MPETNPILQSLYARKSVRVFEEKAIPAGMKQAILEAAAQAPSAGCQQLYTILDITDPALKAALADSCDHQPFIAKAPLVLVFCADCRKWYDAYKEAGCTPRTPGVGDLMLAVTDTAIAAQNAVVAAESFGIGSCYIGDIMENCDTQRSLLHLPDYVFPAVMLVFGWPTQQQKDRPKPQRCAMELPQDITVGKGSLSKLPEIAKKLGGKHALIISGPHLEKMGLVKKAADYLASVDIKADTFTDIEANPSVATVEKATAKYLESGADFIVAFGGGSPMDVAKAVGVVAKYGGSVTDYEGAHKVPGPIVPLIAIPTTAGTGSEVTAFSVITDHSRNYKLTVFSYEILPKYAILDAELITTAPASVAAACGIDAFIHAEEAYVSTAASPFSDALAEKAMALIGKNIRRFVANRNDIEAAEAMMTGSLFAGIAFSFARLGNVHAMSHPVSAFFDVPHGVANAVLLPVIAEYNALADHGKYQTIYNDISPIPAYADEFEPMMLVDAIRELCTDIGIPENLTIAINNASKTGTVTKEEIESRIEPMAVDAMKSGNIAVNPRASRQCDIEMLYRRAL